MKTKGTVISNNTFVGVQFDEQATEVLQTVASALFNITKIFHAQNIQIDAMLKIDGGHELNTNEPSDITKIIKKLTSKKE